ncbi:MAG: twin-arginine translocase TatA/TatE family subunit [Alishewanella aestuarii]
MGFAGVSVWQLLIVLLIVVLLFGTKKLRQFGSDAGTALRELKQGLRDNEPENRHQQDNKHEKA